MSFMKKGMILISSMFVLFSSALPVFATTETPVKTEVPCPPSYVGQQKCFIMINPKKPNIVNDVVPEREVKTTIGSGTNKSRTWYTLLLGVLTQAAATTPTGQKVVTAGEETITEMDLALGREVDAMLAREDYAEPWENGYTDYRSGFSYLAEFGVDAFKQLKTRTDVAFGVYDYKLRNAQDMPSFMIEGLQMPPLHSYEQIIRDRVIGWSSGYYVDMKILGYIGGGYWYKPPLYSEKHTHYYAVQALTNVGEWHDIAVTLYGKGTSTSGWTASADGVTGEGETAFTRALKTYLDHSSQNNIYMYPDSVRALNINRPFEKGEDMSRTPVGMGTMVMPNFKSVPNNPDLDSVTIPKIVEDDTGKKYWEETPLLQPGEVDTGKRYIPFTPDEVSAGDIVTEQIIVVEDGKQVYEDGTVSPDPVTDPVTNPDPTNPPGDGGGTGGDGEAQPDQEKIKEKSREWGRLITTKFPFSLPWDFAYILSFLLAEPKTPVFEVDEEFVNGMKIQFKVDMSWADTYISWFRFFLILGFCYLLIMKTRTLMGGAQ